jgi:hypothetical protein
MKRQALSRLIGLFFIVAAVAVAEEPPRQS